MQEMGLPDVQAISRKAYEIAYALCRIAPATGNALGDILVRKGIELLDSALEADSSKVGRLLDSMEYLIKLGCGIDSISQRNTDAVIAQTGFLREALLKSRASTHTHGRQGGPDSVDLSGIFSDGFGNKFVKSGKADKDSSSGGLGVEEPGDPAIIIEPKPSAIPESAGDEIHGGNSGFAASLSSGIRQSAILNRIRQSGNCRMKDLQEAFPQCSERTLRYDLEYLVGRRLVERVGAGSATAYKPVEAV
jgi:hypothetical protein